MSEKTTLMRLREDERETRKSLIVEAALKLFTEKPFHEIGMRDIAAEAGLSPASIYRYFSSQEDLYVEALILDMNKIEELLEQRIGEGRDSIEELAVAVVDYLIDNEATFQMMCHFLIRGDKDHKAYNKFNAVQRYFLNMFDDVIKRANKTEELRIFTPAFFASLVGVVMIFRNYPGYSKEERREFMHRLALMILT